MKKAIVILGPTCTGKTSIAANLQKRFGLEIVSADSRQIYKGMDFGTGKKPQPDKSIIFGYDLVAPGDYFSAFDYNTYVSHLMLKNPFLLVGGTGFYIDTLLGKVEFSAVPPNAKVRQELNSLELEELVNRLKELNPQALEKIDQKNKIRLIRAIEIQTAPKESTSLNGNSTVVTPKLLIGLTANREFLYKRADAWLESIFTATVAETKTLLSSGYENTSQLNGLIYKTIKDLLAERVDEAFAKERCKFDLHAYIRRQQTYFKRMQGITWFDISEKGFDTKLIKLVESKLNE